MAKKKTNAFVISRWAWIWCAGAAVVLAASAASLNPPGSVYAAQYLEGAIIGGSLCVLLLPLFGAWLAFRISKRNAKVATIAFAILVGATLAAQIGMQVSQRRFREAVTDLQLAIALTRQAPAGIPEPTAQLNHSEEVTRRALTVAEQAPASEAAPLRAMLGVTGRLNATMRRYQEALGRMSERSPFKTPPTQRSQINAFREAAKAFREENNAVRRFVLAMEQTADAEARKEKLTGAARKLFDAQIGTTLLSGRRAILKMRDQDDEMVDALLKIVDLLETQSGQWTYDAQKGLYLFESQAALAEFQKLGARLDTISREQIQFQAESVKAMQNP